MSEEDQKDQWVEIALPKEIVAKLLQRNQQHFGQAKDTPFNIPPLSMEIDCKATTRSIECVLEGEHDISAMDDCGEMQNATNEFIEHLERDAEEVTI